MSSLTRRSFLGLPGRPAAIKLGIDAHLGPGNAWSEPLMAFARELGIEWVATPLRATQGKPMEPAFVPFGERNCINHVHFRNVRTTRPISDYTEAFIDEGQADMLAAMKALREVGFRGMLVPDHAPVIAGDPNQFGSWGFALGYIKALLQAAAALV